MRACVTLRSLLLHLALPLAAVGCATPPRAQAPTTPAPPATPGRTVAEVLAATVADDWEALKPEHLLVMDLPQGRVVIELAEAFAPRHVANVHALAKQGYFDGLAIVRVQDNYVTQWGDPHGDDAHARGLGLASAKLPAEFFAPTTGADAAPFTPLPDPDTYAPETGFSLGFPAAQDRTRNQRWLPHCYAMVGAGRNEAPDSSNGAELYVVIGQAPRHLDRNMTMVGRVVQGMDLLASLRRGTGPLGFYATEAERTPIVRARVAFDMAPHERPRLERLRTDTAAFRAYLEARRARREAFFVEPLGRLDVCNVQVPVRPAP
jgi:peptidylprolyl isomerase